MRWSMPGEGSWPSETGVSQVGSDDVLRRCERRVAELRLPPILDMVSVRAKVSETTGRPIEVRVVEMPPSGPSGAWISIRGVDVVYVAASTSRDHQGQVELHELSHILAGHDAVPVSSFDEDLLGLLLPDLDPSLVRRILCRTFYSEAAEYEAELLATLIASAGTDWVPEPRRPISQPDVNGILERIYGDLSTR